MKQIIFPELKGVVRKIKAVKRTRGLADVKRDISNVLIAIEGCIESNNPLTPFDKGAGLFKIALLGKGFHLEVVELKYKKVNINT